MSEVDQRFRNSTYFDPTDPLVVDGPLRTQLYFAYSWGGEFVSVKFLMMPKEDQEERLRKFGDWVESANSAVVDRELVKALGRILESRPLRVRAVIDWALSVDSRFAAWESSLGHSAGTQTVAVTPGEPI